MTHYIVQETLSHSISHDVTEETISVGFPALVSV